MVNLHFALVEFTGTSKETLILFLQNNIKYITKH